jgi:ceramide glucosyltransferase
MTNALEAANLPIVFCPECLAATLHPWTGTQLLEFTNRQIQITRVYSQRRWMMGALAHLSYSLTLLFAFLFTFNELVEGDPWVNLALITLVIPLLAAMKGVVRTIAVNELLPEHRAKLREWGWVWSLLAPVIPFLFSWNFIISLVSKRILWRGIRYELVAANQTRILRR